MSCVENSTNADGYSCVVNGTVQCDDVNSCTSDRCVDSFGCQFRDVPCPPGGNDCEYAFQCNGTFLSAQCEYTQLAVSCGTCVLNSTICNSAIGIGEIAGIAAGAIVGIVIAAIIAAILLAYFSKRGYDYYVAQSQMEAANTMNNPYFTTNELAGDVPN